MTEAKKPTMSVKAALALASHLGVLQTFLDTAINGLVKNIEYRHQLRDVLTQSATVELNQQLDEADAILTTLREACGLSYMFLRSGIFDDTTTSTEKPMTLEMSQGFFIQLSNLAPLLKTLRSCQGTYTIDGTSFVRPMSIIGMHAGQESIQAVCEKILDIFGEMVESTKTEEEKAKAAAAAKPDITKLHVEIMKLADIVVPYADELSSRTVTSSVGGYFAGLIQDLVSIQSIIPAVIANPSIIRLRHRVTEDIISAHGLACDIVRTWGDNYGLSGKAKAVFDQLEVLSKYSREEVAQYEFTIPNKE